MADHNDAADLDYRVGRTKRPLRSFGVIAVVGLFLVGGFTVFAPGVFTPDQAPTAEQSPTEGADRDTSTLRLLPAPSAEPLNEREGEPTAVPASGRGTELFDSLPQQIGSFVLVQIAATETSGALEYYSGTYTNVDEQGDAVPGEASVKLTVSRWGTEAEAMARAEQNRQSVVAEAQSATEVPVQSRTQDGLAYGVAADEDMTILWSDFTTAGSISGAPDDVKNIFDDFSLGNGSGALQRR